MRRAARMLANPMIICPACGKENEDVASECKRCRAPLRGEESAAEAVELPQSLGEVCRRCEAYNEPGVSVCTNCGLQLFAAPASGQPPLDKTPPDAFTPPSQVPETLSEELRALAISDEEAAEAGLTMAARSGVAIETTPPAAFAPPGVAQSAAGRAHLGEAVLAVAASGAAPARRPPPAPPRAPPPPPVLGAALPAGKACPNCGALNPPAAKFCFECGTPFARKAAGPRPPSIEVAAELPAETFEDATMESSPVALDEPVPAESAAEPIPEEQPPPFAAKLVLQNGSAEGTEFALGHLENSLGGSAAHIGLGDDPFIAPHAATLAFVDERLVLRDEGSANGVYVRVRESAALEPGDLFVAGERLLRYEGPVEMAPPIEGDLPLLGAPRPAQGPAYRVTEVLLGAKTGRTCHRGAPIISIGRAGCDMNFAGDSLLAAKHAEIRIAEDGTAALADLGQGPSGVFLRVRAQQPVELQAGDVVRVGDQHLRVDVG
ncbi:MAG: zinc-ribbon domain-containing protein [Deltaproteobacteria bacterium]|nr:MAG: zinc-ribbon domain-containing protein [Deltaproteobacteria bacterium]